MLPQDKYQNYSDPAMRDRIAFLAASSPTFKAAKPPPLEPSGFTPSGWDKYYFFSNPYQGTKLHPTAGKGRMRPAMAGPQTFNIEPFSKEDLVEARKRMGGQGARTAYTETFSQLPRTRIAQHGPVDHQYDAPKAEYGASLTRTASEPMLRERSAADILLGHAAPLKRSGPHWPPPTQERPDPVKVRRALMGGADRTLDDLHAKDRQAPSTMIVF
mmetsp:Transcript_83133/g.238846  ORF Transcript_83133/g.238846 Transcript_83133/m.238846 type:complete len:215 (+) Transcript_83133:66-710(+)